MVYGSRSFGYSDGSHRPIMLAEVLECLRPAPGDIAVDCTLGGGGHARAILERIQPGGRLIGLDIDAAALAHTEASFRREGAGDDAFTAHHLNFNQLRDALAATGVVNANVVLADLGVSSMQIEDPSRGFSYKLPGPLDMRMDRSRGETGPELLARVSEGALAELLRAGADEPHADAIARRLKQQSPATTHALEKAIRHAVTDARPQLAKADVKLSVRRTFQALRIAVNDEYGALDALLRQLPGILASGGRAAVITFHSGEDARVEQALRSGHDVGVYSSIAVEAIRSKKAETYSNRRAQAAKLRWAVRA